MLNKIDCGEFSVISVGRNAAIVRGEKVGPLFRNETDAIDWGYDTACGDAIPPEYDIIPLRGDAARVILAALAMSYNGGAND